MACASVELADTSGYGSEVWLKVHIDENLHPSVYLCSETQERFMWVSPPKLTKKILNHYNKAFDLPGVSSGAQASVIGKITKEKQYVVHSNGEKIIDAPAEEVTKGFLYNRPYENPENKFKEPNIEKLNNYNNILENMLSHENIASRSIIYEPMTNK